MRVDIDSNKGEATKVIVDAHGSDASDIIAGLRSMGLVVEEGSIGSCDVCKHIACVCVAQRRHAESCRFRLALTCAVPIECEHGCDVCPECDACDCGAGVEAQDFGPSVVEEK